MEDNNHKLYGITVNLPYCLKCSSKANAVVIFILSIIAKLVQSVKEKPLSSYLSNILQPFSQSRGVMGSMVRKAMFLRILPNLKVALLPIVLESRLKVSSRTRSDVIKFLF